MHKNNLNLLVYPEGPGGVKRNPHPLAVGEGCDGGGAEVAGGEGGLLGAHKPVRDRGVGGDRQGGTHLKQPENREQNEV